MTTKTDLLPLPEWTKRDDLGGLVPSEVRAEIFTYLRANMEPLRRKLRRLTFELDAATIYGNDRDAHYQQAEARAAHRKG